MRIGTPDRSPEREAYRKTVQKAYEKRLYEESVDKKAQIILDVIFKLILKGKRKCKSPD